MMTVVASPSSSSIHVLVIFCYSFLLVTGLLHPVGCSNPVRHQRHRNNHTHQSEEMQQQHEPMSMSTSGCSHNTSGEVDCASPSKPNPSPSAGGRTSRQVGDQIGTGGKVRNNSRGKCFEERDERQRLAIAAKRGSSEYIPTCRGDGSYATVQCHLHTKSCWCVSRGGRPVPGSSVLLSNPHDNKRPNCAKYLRQGKSTTKRRSSHGKKNPKSCNYADRSRFNAALTRTFKSEYNRYKSATLSYFESDGASDEIVLAWKFDTLDRNRDGILHKNETLILKHLVKQQIQPRSCSKNFISFCAKGDQKIVKREWLECLRLPSVDNRSSPGGGTNPLEILRPGGNRSGGDYPFNPLRPGGGIIETHETSNCWTDRQSALASQIRNESVIIPECTVGGLYHKVQCAQGKTYCWCVEEEGGIQIPNTLVVNSVPDCSKRYSKPMTGCSGQKKQKFLSDLLDSLMKRMTSAINEGRFRIPGTNRHMSIQEQSVRWYFSQLDDNSDGILDRSEWKFFRTEVSKDKRLKRCGKKLPRHCDANGDRRLSESEWVDCLGVELFTTRTPNSPDTHTRRPVHRSNGRRNGKNPFTNILKQR
ncbi:SPARC-related modular calcium-binding protein 1 [Folsomia candida]|uniref:SPARC-related modular calcium-binding protein 1 n=1 Tax=Folsomia candida TaxID=158441 RepID=A0A226ETE1_FOLCA|nr:SPARC-related modular calcium-binding protein 1 [Folsomia candida]OXA60885.1 SPARC-related modular calcium-binding protein 1 [Folsomia candida]